MDKEERIFICVHCERQAEPEEIKNKTIWLSGRKKEVITVWCPNCKVHSHFLKKEPA